MLHVTVHEAIQAGIDDMEAGRSVPFEEMDLRISRRLGIDPLS
jgi:predicted transcriptional regulator